MAAENRPSQEIENPGDGQEIGLANVKTPLLFDEVARTNQPVDSQADYALGIVRSANFKTGIVPPDSINSCSMRIRKEAIFKLMKLK